MQLKMYEMGPAGKNRKVGSRGWPKLFGLRRLSGPVLLATLAVLFPAVAPAAPPSAPAALTGWAVGASVYLNWTPSLPGTYPVSGYEIFRATCVACPSDLLTWTPEATTEYSDAMVTLGLTYEYRVRALDGYGGASGTVGPAIVEPPLPPGILTCAMAVSPSATTVGDSAMVRMTVFNNGANPVSGLTPWMMPGPGYVDGPDPAGPVSLSPGSSVTFTWDYLATGVWPVTEMLFSATVTGQDAVTGAPLACQSAARLRILPSARLELAATVSPAVIAVGQAVTLTLGVRNAGTGAASLSPTAILPPDGCVSLQSGPAPAGPVTVGPGETMQFSWVLLAGAAGTVVVRPGVSGTDQTTGQPLAADTPVQLTINGAPPGSGLVTVIGGERGTVNPWDGEALTIMIKSPVTGNVTVSIYSLNGILVYDTSAYCQANVPRLVIWDGRNRSGTICPPGGYGLTVSSPGRRTIHKGKVLLHRWR